MADVFNSIPIGFRWEQDMALPADLLAPGDGMRAEFRYAPEDEAPIFSITSVGNDGIVIDGLDVALTLTGARTELIDPPDPVTGWRDLYTDFVRLIAGGGEDHMGFRLRIPAEISVTRSAE